MRDVIISRYWQGINPVSCDFTLRYAGDTVPQNSFKVLSRCEMYEYSHSKPKQPNLN